MKKTPFLQSSNKNSVDAGVVSTNVKMSVNKSSGTLNEWTTDEKMVIALRKAISSKGGTPTAGTSYHLHGNEVYVTRRSGGAKARPSDSATYFATGRCQIAMADCSDRACFYTAEFRITFRDSVDDRGVSDVIVIDPTSIDILPKRAKLIP